jgi:selenide,water dikinase
MKDLAKRKRIMQRSMRLGHCICDPKNACPCALFKEKDVCLCAGERLEAPSGPVRLTRLVEKAGCASKIDLASLKNALKGLPSLDDPRVLVGMAAGDDAGVFKLSDGLALVQTVDVFSPSVDDPYTFGQVAAANSLSDVYAMGGRPITALSVIGFPTGTVPDGVMRDILRGGIDKMAEAGVPVIGGHSIKDEEIKAGFAVTGLIDPDRMTTNAGARPGDVMILTKPIGTGIIAFAAQIDRAPAGATEATARSETLLNKTASELMLQFGAHACTDVTGFGLVGHLAEMAFSSQVDVEIVWDDIPLFPGVMECVAAEIIPGGVERNRESSGAQVLLGPGVQPAMLDVCLDPQTSGGLLIVLPKAEAKALLERLHGAGLSDSAIIGRVSGKGSGRILLSTRGRRPIPERETAPATKPAVAAEPAEPCCADSEEVCRSETAGNAAPGPSAEECHTDMGTEEKSCCSGDEAGGHAGHGAASGIPEIEDKFKEFMKSAGTPGALDAATKQAVAIALSVLARCEPCVKAHVRKARSMGFSQEEIDEAAWMAISFGGSPVMMFYNSVKGG